LSPRLTGRKDNKKAFQRAFKADTSTQTGLILSQRVFNLPDALALPLCMALFDEVAWGCEDEKTEELRNQWKFGQYFILTRVIDVPESVGEKEKHKKPRHGEQKARGQQKVGQTRVFVKSEDEQFYKVATERFEFATEEVAEDGMVVRGLAMLLPATAAQAILDGLKHTVGTSAIQSVGEEDASAEAH